MKIAVASDDGKTVCGHLGRCSSFIIFETDDEKIQSSTIRGNSFTSHALGDCAGGHDPGESNHSHQGILSALDDCQVVLSRGMGRRVAIDLENVGIKAILTSQTDAATAVQAFLDGRLESFGDNFCGCGGIET